MAKTYEVQDELLRSVKITEVVETTVVNTVTIPELYIKYDNLTENIRALRQARTAVFALIDEIKTQVPSIAGDPVVAETEEETT